MVRVVQFHCPTTGEAVPVGIADDEEHFRFRSPLPERRQLAARVVRITSGRSMMPSLPEEP